MRDAVQEACRRCDEQGCQGVGDPPETGNGEKMGRSSRLMMPAGQRRGADPGFAPIMPIRPRRSPRSPVRSFQPAPDLSTEVAIVGGGLVGLSLAVALAGAGIKVVVV